MKAVTKLEKGFDGMQVWIHKESEVIALVAPWWEVIKKDEMISGTSEQLAHDGLTEDTWPTRKYKIGTLSQIGWLIQGPGGVWVGVGPGVKEAFEYIGEF